MTETTDAIAYEVQIKWTPENGNHGHPLTVISELHPHSPESPYSGDSDWTILDFTPLGPLSHETDAEVDFEVKRERLLNGEQTGVLKDYHGLTMSCADPDCHIMTSAAYIWENGKCHCGQPQALVLLSGEKPEDDQ